jgi:hypothetical protein
MNTRRRPPLAEIPIDTLGKLADGAYRLSGHCLICRKDFDVALDLLIRTRGRDCEIVGMKPLKCLNCQGFHTELRILPPKRGTADQWRTPRTIAAANDRADRDR